MDKILKILYINVIELNAGWGAETFINKAFQELGHNVTNLDFRKNRKVLASKLKKINEFDVLFLQRGDRFPKYLLKACNRPKFFWASELVTRNRDQDRLLKSNLFEHIFVHSNDCKSIIKNNKWINKRKLTVLLNGFDSTIHNKFNINKDIDILFVGSILPRREKILTELRLNFNIKVCKAFGNDMSQLMNRSKIVLNIHAEEYLDTETRVFESLGCGAFLISEKLSSENPFTPNNHYIEVNSIDEMKSKINYFLNNPIERDKIANKGYIEAYKKHSYKNRAKELINIFSQYTNISNKKAFDINKLKYFSYFERFRNKFRSIYK